MLDLDVQPLETHPEWRQVLLAYAAARDAVVEANNETADLVAKGFRPRLKTVDGVPADQLTRIHGWLIAHGFLQVEISGRTGGMLYQLTSHGRQACLRLSNAANAEADLQLATA